MSNGKLSYGDKCIIARNQNEIKDLQEYLKKIVDMTSEAIEELRKQNRQIIGRE